MYIIVNFYLFFLLSIVNITRADVIEDANKYTVKIKSSIQYPFYEDKAGTGKGAGFLIDKKKGWVFTNAHVSGRGNARIQVAFKNKKYIKAKIYYVDPLLDIAIIKVNPKNIDEDNLAANLQCNQIKLNGIEVAAYGHPEGLSFSASRGIISQKRYKYGADWLQTDAAINPGNSGGPLISLQNGKVVGMNSMGFKKSKGLNFAVPSKILCKIYKLLLNNENPSPPILPFRFATNNQLEKYMSIGIFKNKKLLDVLAGDIVTHINNNLVKTPTELSSFLRGDVDKAFLTFKRNKKVYKKEIEFKKFPLLTERKFILMDGAIIADDYFLERKNIEKLYLVHSVEDGSVAEENGLYRGLLIVSVNGKHPDTIEQLYLGLNSKNKIDIIFKGWSRSDNVLYDYHKINFQPKELKLY